MSDLEYSAMSQEQLLLTVQDKDAEIERLENDITTFIRDAFYAGYMAGVEDSEDYDHDPVVMEEHAFIEYLQKALDDDEEV